MEKIHKELTAQKYLIKFIYRGLKKSEQNDTERLAKDLNMKQVVMMSGRGCPLTVNNEKGEPMFTKEEKAHVSAILNVDIKKLDPLVDGSYWDTFRLVLEKGVEKTIDLNTRKGFCEYLIAMSLPEVVVIGQANVKNNPGASFVMYTEEEEESIIDESVENMYKSMEMISKHDKQPDTHRDMLKLYLYTYKSNAQVGPSTPDAKIKRKLMQYASENPNGFIKLMEAEDFKERILLINATDTGVIREKRGDFYSSFDDQIPFASTLNDAIKYLANQKNEKEVKAIKAEVNKRFKITTK